MTDKAIIKELQCASEWFTQHGSNTNTAIIGICGRAVDLINRQKAEIEKLRDLNAVLETDDINANMNLEHITYEFDLLKQEKAVIQAEAIKEFAEIIISDYPEMEYYLDNLVKEMIGAQE